MREDFEKIRDEVELKVKQAIRNWRLRQGLSDLSVFTRKDLGIKALSVIQQQGRDNGIGGHEIQKTIDKVGWSVENQTTRKERVAHRFLESVMSRGYFAYAKLRKTLSIPIECPTIRWWNYRYLNPILSFINPGGGVFLKGGTTYPLGSTPLVLNDLNDIMLFGEGSSSILSVSSDVNVLNIYGTNPFDSVGITIANLKVLGTGSAHTANGIRVSNVHYVTIDNCLVEDCGIGINFDGNEIDNSVISKNKIVKSYLVGIRLSGSVEENSVFGNIIDGRGAVGKGRGIQAGGTRNTFFGNTIEAIQGAGGVNSNDGLYVDGDKNVMIGNTIRECTRYGVTVSTDNNLIQGNLIEDNLTRGINLASGAEYNHILGNQVIDNVDYGIICVAGANNNWIMNNRVQDHTTAQISDSGTGNVIRNNSGFVTENSGSSSVDNGQTTKVVAHGLDVTPSAEDFTIIGKENPDNDVGTIWVDTIGAANFTVNVENDPGASNWDFGWKVIVL